MADSDAIYGLSAADVLRLREALRWVEGQGSTQTSQRRRGSSTPALPVICGKATAAWSSATPNIITVNPCADDGLNPDTGITITVQLVLPSTAAPGWCSIAKGDIVSYLSLWNSAAGEVRGLAVGLGSKLRKAGEVFPVTLAQTGGSQGTNAAAASWTYTVTDTITSASLGTAVNPVSSPHLWRRPSIGQLAAATAGLAYFTTVGVLVIIWVNEAVGPGACGA
jgi:hypothetical protein